jgi:hypothetical protein
MIHHRKADGRNNQHARFNPPFPNVDRDAEGGRVPFKVISGPKSGFFSRKCVKLSQKCFSRLFDTSFPKEVPMKSTIGSSLLLSAASILVLFLASCLNLIDGDGDSSEASGPAHTAAAVSFADLDLGTGEVAGTLS